VYTYTNVNTFIYVNIYIYIYIDTYTYIHIYIYTYMYIYIYTNYIHVHLHISIYLYKYIYIWCLPRHKQKRQHLPGALWLGFIARDSRGNLPEWARPRAHVSAKAYPEETLVQRVCELATRLVRGALALDTRVRARTHVSAKTHQKQPDDSS